MIHAGWSMSDEIIAQFLGNGGGEEAGVRIGKLVELGVHGGQHIGMAVTEAGDCGSPRRVDVLLPRVVADDHAFAGLGNGVGVGDAAVQEAGHERSLCQLNQHDPRWPPLRQGPCRLPLNP